MQGQNYSFVVRVWLESASGDGDIAMWRGSIEQVGSDYRAYFSGLDRIGHIIQTQIGREVPSTTTGWRLTWEQLQNDIRKFWKRLFRRSPH